MKEASGSEQATSVRVGGLEVIALRDACGSFGRPWVQAFSGGDDADWDVARRLDPMAFGPDGTWRLLFACFAIRLPGGQVIIVDTGIGPLGSPAAQWAPVPGRLPQALVEVGVAASDVEVVVLTHLHEDHVGWGMGEDRSPFFPNASYLVQSEELRQLAGQPHHDVWEYIVEPLQSTEQLRPVEGPVRLVGAAGAVDTVTVVPTPGHTPGHQSVLVDGEDAMMAITGDVLVHAVQLANVEVGYCYELDPVQAAQTRRQLISDVKNRGGLLATAHMHRLFIPSTTLGDDRQ